MSPEDPNRRGQVPATTHTTLRLNRALHNGFYLDSHLIEPDNGSVTHNAKQQHIPPKALKVLLLLASYPGEVVRHQDLLATVWHNPDAKVGLLSSTVSEIRHLLNDHCDNPTFIQTHPGKGYQLLLTPALLQLSPVQEADEDLPANRLSSLFAGKRLDTTSPWYLPIDLLRRSRVVRLSTAYIVVAWMLIQIADITLPIFNVPDWGQRLLVLILLLGLPCVMLTVGFKDIRQRHRYYRQLEATEHKRSVSAQLKVDTAFILLILVVISVAAQQLYFSIDTSVNGPQADTGKPQLPAQPVTDNAVAILPFTPTGEQSVPDYILTGLQYELIAYLTQNPDYRVSSRRATLGLPLDAPLELIKNRLGVKYILEAQIERQDSQLILKSTMTDSQSGFQIWSDTLSGHQHQLLAVQSTLARRVTNALALLVNIIDKPAPTFQPTEDFVAFDLYMQAREQLRQADDRQSMETAGQMFTRALTRDRGLTLATSGLCQTYLDLYVLELNTADFQQAEQACGQLLDDELTRTASQTALANLYRTSGEYARAEALYRQVQGREAQAVNALTGLAQLYGATNRGEQAEALYQKIISLEPGYWKNYQQYGGFLFARGRYQEASIQFEHQLELAPAMVSAYTNLGGAYFMTGLFDKASAAWRQSLALSPSAKSYTNLGSALYFSLDFDEAARMYQRATELNPTNYIFWANYGDALKFIPEKREHTREVFSQAVALVRENININANDPILQSSLARYLSELDDCDAAALHEREAIAADAGDPYLFYDLAIAALNCNQQTKAKVLVEQMIGAGYPAVLLHKDPLFNDITKQLPPLSIDQKENAP